VFWTAIGFGRNDCEIGRNNAENRRVTVRELCEMIPDVSKTCIDEIAARRESSTIQA
jgi:hypothetical protein